MLCHIISFGNQVILWLDVIILGYNRDEKTNNRALDKVILKIVMFEDIYDN